MRRGVAMILGGQWSRYAIQLLALVLFSRLLTPADFGLVAMVTTVVGVASVVGDFGLSLAALQAQHLSRPQKSNLFWMNSLIGLGMAALVAALAAPIAAFYGDERVAPVTMLFAPIFLLNGMGVQFRTELLRTGRYATVAAVEVCGQACGFAGGLVIALVGGGYWALIAMPLVAAIVTNAASAIWSRWLPGLYDRREVMGPMLKFGSFTFLTQVVNYVSANIDQVVIGYVWGPASLGQYNRAIQLSRVPLQQVASPLTRVMLPELSRRLTDHDAYRATVRRIQLALSYALVGLLAFVFASASSLIPVLLGEGWSESVPILQALSIAGIFQSIAYVGYWVLLSHARTGLLFASELVGRVVMVVLMIVLVQFGPFWVAMAVVVGQVLIFAANLFIALPRARVPVADTIVPALRPLVVFAIAGTLTLLLNWWLEPILPALLSLVISGVTFTLASAAWLALPSYRRDLARLVKLVRRRETGP